MCVRDLGVSSTHAYRNITQGLIHVKQKSEDISMVTHVIFMHIS